MQDSIRMFQKRSSMLVQKIRTVVTRKLRKTWFDLPLLDPLWRKVVKLEPYAVAGERQWYNYAVSQPMRTKNGVRAHILGTCHVSHRSAQSAGRIVRTIKPRFVGVELRSANEVQTLLKLHNIVAPAFWNMEGIRNLAYGNGRLGDLVFRSGTVHGFEFAVAMATAVELKIDYGLIDEPTLGRDFDKFQTGSVDELEEMLELVKLQLDGAVEFDKLSAQYRARLWWNPFLIRRSKPILLDIVGPALLNKENRLMALLTETVYCRSRDQHMVRRLDKMAAKMKKGDAIVAIVGRAHVLGVRSDGMRLLGWTEVKDFKVPGGGSE
ncbi:hypothetical protein HK104_001361 [Borealophlyctis nickersoniae]|nr:hypothetical protein HK104_001361 [Borealophlyctis nickersoniae]